MEKQTKNLGHVTAYGYAKSQGYTGTEEEYAELMASYATVAERAETAAESAEESAQEVKDVIPEVTAQDNGKVMMVENGEWGAGEVDVLPTVTSQDNGKVLGVVEGQWAPAEPEDGLPEVTSSDNGKVLSVVEGAWAPAVPSGGSGLPEVTSEDNGDILSVVDGAWAKSEPGYRPAMVDGTVIIPVQTKKPEADGTFYSARIGNFYFDLVRDWFDNDSKPGTLPVTFNGTGYVVPTTAIETTDARGSKRFYCGEVDGEGVPVFTTYPFIIQFQREVSEDESDDSVVAFTPTDDYFIIKSVEEVRDEIPTEDFKLAVNNSYMETTESEKEFIPAQSVTTAASEGSSYAKVTITDVTIPGTPPSALHVTFDGTEYDLPAVAYLGYGAPYYFDECDFTTYPLSVYFSLYQRTCTIRTPEAGTYTLEATYDVSTAVPTEKFKEAVKQSGGGMQTVMFEVYYDDSGETTPEHIIVTCDKTIDELIAADGPLFAQAVLWQTNPTANAIAAAAFENYGSAYAEFQFLQFFTESPQELRYTKIFWNSGLEKWTVGFYEYGLTPLT